MNQWQKGNEIVLNAQMLSEGYVPEVVLGRERQLKRLRGVLAPLLRKDRSTCIWVSGPPGSGKTATVKYLLRSIGREAGTKCCYVNCWERGTLHSVLEKIIDDLRILGAERSEMGFKLERLRRHLGLGPFILALDECDRPVPKERNAILYHLSGIEGTAIICACAGRFALSGLDERVKSRLNGLEIEFPPYRPSEVFLVLKDRAERALSPGSWDAGVLRKISEMAGGDARVALRTLKSAGFSAERAGRQKIEAEDVKNGWSDARRDGKTYRLQELTEDHRILYEIIKAKGEVLSSHLWEEYLAETRKRSLRPMAPRTYLDYVNKLRDIGLIRAERARVRGRVRAFRAVE